MRMSVFRVGCLVASLLLLLAGSGVADARIGLFEAQSDVGGGLLPGSAQFNSLGGEYQVSGGGANMWGTEDAFHYVHSRLSGNVRLSCRIHFLGEGGDPHRKAGLMIRQTLEADSSYVDIVVHGDGLASLQFREEKSGETQEIQTSVKKPSMLVLEREADSFTVWVGESEPELQKVGSVQLSLTDPVYAGLVVCAHDASRLETAVFRRVTLQAR